MSKKLKVLLTVRPVWLLLVAACVAFLIGVVTPVSAPVRGPLVDINDTILIAVLVTLGGFVAQLYLRMGKLEADLEKFRDDNNDLRSDLSAAASFINRIGWWVAKGCKGPMPRPAKRLDEHIDAGLWSDDAAVGGTD